MSDAASSPAAAEAPKPGSRAALIQQRQAAVDLAERRAEMVAKQEAEMRALEEQQAALSVAMDSTMERSLRENLIIAHSDLLADYDDDKEAQEIINGNKYGEDDLIDAEFWETGIAEPADLPVDVAEAMDSGKGLNEQQTKQAKATVAEWKAAYFAIEEKFVARALLARELKIVFAKKREQLKAARAQVAQSSAVAAVAEKKVERAIAMVVKTSGKKCGCGTKCPPQCGCRRSGFGCSAECRCGVDGCLNPHSYTESPEDQAKLAAAMMAAGRLALQNKKARADAAKEAALHARLEAGQLDQSF